MKAGYWSNNEAHAWVGTSHCLRRAQRCMNDHTGCFYNTGQNVCQHHKPFEPGPSGFDSPLHVTERRSMKETTE